MGGDDLICGGQGADEIVGGAGSDEISGDVGSDRIEVSSTEEAETKPEKKS